VNVLALKCTGISSNILIFLRNDLSWKCQQFSKSFDFEIINYFLPWISDLCLLYNRLGLSLSSRFEIITKSHSSIVHWLTQIPKHH